MNWLSEEEGLYPDESETSTLIERHEALIKKVAQLETALQDIMHGTKDEWAEKIARNALEKQL